MTNRVPLIQEHLNSVSRKSSICDLIVAGNLHGASAVWLIRSYHKADDIADGMLCIAAPGFSEYGSAYGAELLRYNLSVMDAEPVPFKTCINWELEDAVAHIAQGALA